MLFTLSEYHQLSNRKIIDRFALSGFDIFGIVFDQIKQSYKRLSTFKKNFMKTLVYFIIVLLAVSCLKSGENTYYISTTGRVKITQSDIPDTVTQNMYAEIKLRAEESNACWSNLNFQLTQNNNFDYTLEAFGLFQSYGSCEPIKVVGDTTIAFKPTQTGIYKFHVLKSETESAVDTMIVVGPI